MTDYPPPALHAIWSAAVDIATLPADLKEPAAAFDSLAAHFGLEFWPLPEFSHDQFLRDHDHAGWLAEWSRLEGVLRVVDLDQPWVLRAAGVSTAVYYAECGLCNHQTTDRRKRPRDANRDGASHAHLAHGWSAPTKFARDEGGKFVGSPS